MSVRQHGRYAGSVSEHGSPIRVHGGGGGAGGGEPVAQLEAFVLVVVGARVDGQGHRKVGVVKEVGHLDGVPVQAGAKGRPRAGDDVVLFDVEVARRVREVERRERDVLVQDRAGDRRLHLKVDADRGPAGAERGLDAVRRSVHRRDGELLVRGAVVARRILGRVHQPAPALALLRDVLRRRGPALALLERGRLLGEPAAAPSHAS